jgi:hypothetical protein
MTTWIVKAVTRHSGLTYAQVIGQPSEPEVSSILDVSETGSRYRLLSIGTASPASWEAGFRALQLECIAGEDSLVEGMTLVRG